MLDRMTVAGQAHEHDVAARRREAATRNSSNSSWII
jgi:hypothetical protein